MVVQCHAAPEYRTIVSSSGVVPVLKDLSVHGDVESAAFAQLVLSEAALDEVTLPTLLKISLAEAACVAVSSPMPSTQGGSETHPAITVPTREAAKATDPPEVNTEMARAPSLEEGVQCAPESSAERVHLAAHWKIAWSRSTGRMYYVNKVTGNSQYELPDENADLQTAHVAATLIQQTWRLSSARHDAHSNFPLATNKLVDMKQVSASTTFEPCADKRPSSSVDNIIGKLFDGADVLSDVDGATWEEVDLTFETEGALGLVFSSDTETGMKIVTELVPGKLAAQVPELSSSFDKAGHPIGNQPALALIEVQTESVELLSFTQAVRSCVCPYATFLICSSSASSTRSQTLVMPCRWIELKMLLGRSR